MSEWKRVAETAARIQQALTEAGKKQTDLVEATGLNKGTISRYISGQVEPKQKAIMALARALDVDEMWLYGYDVPKDRAPEQKRNDTIVDVVSRMRTDSNFFDVVSQLAELKPEEYASITQMISLLRNK